MKRSLSFHSMLLVADRPATKRPPVPAPLPPTSIDSGDQHRMDSEAELKGQAALGSAVVGIIAFLLGFFAVGWILAFGSFIAAGTHLLNPDRGHYWPARVAMGLSLAFVLGLLGFLFYFG